MYDTHSLPPSLPSPLSSGVYVSSLVYSDDSKVLVTVDDHIPIVEVTDSHSSSIGSDFVWLAKVSRETNLQPFTKVNVHVHVNHLYDSKAFSIHKQ